MKSLSLTLICAALLAACGGSAGINVSVAPTVLSAAPITTPLPPVSAPAIAQFSAMAQSADCAGTMNRLFVVDGKQVFWARSGACADNAYSYTLFGATPDQVVCKASDSIAGPRTSCSDESQRANFTLMTENLGKADLGLGKAHTVEELKFLPPGPAKPRAITAFAGGPSALTKPLQQVLLDSDSFFTLWAADQANAKPVPPAPLLNFREQMVLAVSTGQADGACHAAAIDQVLSDGTKLTVAYTQEVLQTFAPCAMGTGGATAMVSVARSDLPVEFVDVSANLVNATLLGISNYAKVDSATTVVAKDAASYSALQQQFGDVALAKLAIDFDRQMVVGVFLGTRPNGCAAISPNKVFTLGGRLNVVYHERTQIPGAMCSMALTSPAMLLVVPKSDLTVLATADGQAQAY